MSKDNLIIALCIIVFIGLTAFTFWDTWKDEKKLNYLKQRNEILSIELQYERTTVGDLKHELACSRAHHEYRINGNGVCQYPEKLGKVDVWVNDFEVGIDPRR
jgi:hypothetical protein